MMKKRTALLLLLCFCLTLVPTIEAAATPLYEIYGDNLELGLKASSFSNIYYDQNGGTRRVSLDPTNPDNYCLEFSYDNAMQKSIFWCSTEKVTLQVKVYYPDFNSEWEFQFRATSPYIETEIFSAVQSINSSTSYLSLGNTVTDRVLSANRWYTVVAEIDLSGNSFRFYLDGEDLGTYTFSKNLSGNSPQGLQLMANNGGTSRIYMDDFYLTEGAWDGTPYTAPSVTHTAPRTMTDIYLSPDGSDDNMGTVDSPLQSLGAAKEKIKNFIPFATEDITVHLAGGEYFLDAPLTFTEAEQKEGIHITFEGSLSDMPSLYAGEVVSGWQQDTGNIYKVYVGKTPVESIYENGTLGTVSRFPNEGYLLATESSSGPSTTVFRYGEGDLSITDWTNAKIGAWPGSDGGDIAWFENVRSVASVNTSTCTITLSGDMWYTMGTGSQYCIRNAYEAIDTPGEFYHNLTTGWLYYYPRTSTENIVVCRNRDLIRVWGGHYDSAVKNMTFTGIRFLGSGEEASSVTLKNTENITIENSIFYGGGNAVLMNGRAIGNTVQNSSITEMNGQGVYITGVSGRDISRDNLIYNNHITRIGRAVGHSTGIGFESSADGNTASHNFVSDVKRSCITINNSGDNIIEFNDLSDGMQTSQDGGLFNSGTTKTGNVVRNNRIHHASAPFSYWNALYLDDDSDGFTIYNNILHDLQTENDNATMLGTMMIKGIGSRVYNNIIADNEKGNGDTAGFVVQKLLATHTTRDNEIYSNVLGNNESPYIYRFIGEVPNVLLSVADNNLFYHTGGSYMVSGASINPATLDQWKTLYGGTFDQNSVTANPLFYDEANRDYRLKKDSPAYALGFTDFNMEDIGLTSEYPFAETGDSLERVFIRPESETVNRSYMEMKVGETETLSLLGRTQNGYVAESFPVRFVSTIPAVVQVDSNGNLTAMGEGSATVIAYYTTASGSKYTAIDVEVKEEGLVCTALSGEQSGTTLTASATVKNYTEEEKKVYLFAVRYVGNRVSGMEVIPAIVPSKGEANPTTTLTGIGQDETVTLYVWTNTLTPLKKVTIQ